MIKATDLRIGNIILFNGRPVHITSLSLDIDDEYEEAIGFCEMGKMSNEGGGYARDSRTEGIPLTPEWLERCGCLKHPNSGLWTVAKIEHEGNIDFFEIEQCDDIISFTFKTGGVWTIGKPFRYLHQLQNLFFVLTGEELTIKETV